MLTYILAIAVGLGSLSIYIAAFFFSEVHRKSDFLWSGVGLFYALILWTCAGRITGAVLLGQMASVALIGWFGWQTLSLRRQVAPAAEQTKIPSKETTGKSFKFPGVGGKGKVTTKSQTEVTPKPVSTTEAKETVAPIATQEETGTVGDFPETEIPTVVQTPTPSESATTETLENLTQPTQTEIETKSELEIPSVAEATSQESEIKPEEKLDKATTKKKAGGFSVLLTPVNELVSGIKNAFGNKDKGKTKADGVSKSVSGEIKSTAGTPETISDAQEQVSVGETETISVETGIQVTEKEEEGMAEVEVRQTEEVRTADGEEEEATVVEKEAIAQVSLTDSGEETPEVSIIKEEVTVTTGGVVSEEIESTEEELKTQELASAEKIDEVESPEVPSVELKKGSNPDSDS